jgi:hypothetical protein
MLEFSSHKAITTLFKIMGQIDRLIKLVTCQNKNVEWLVEESSYYREYREPVTGLPFAKPICAYRWTMKILINSFFD